MNYIDIENLNVCLVESSNVQSKIIKHLLEKIGISKITLYHDGNSALVGMSEVAFDVVISSLYLPDMTGTDLVYEMRNDENLKDVSFILISSETNPRYLDPIRQAGVIGILPKPFTMQQLKQSFVSALDMLNPDSLKLEDSEDIIIEDLKVLLVDDSPTARKYIRSVLEKLGIEHMQEAVNGREAVAIIDTTYFDLIVTDYNMPEMDGKELVEYIRNWSTQSTVPVLMVSSEKDESRLASVQQAGVSAICDKPFEPQGLKRLLTNIIASANE